MRESWADMAAADVHEKHIEEDHEQITTGAGREQAQVEVSNEEEPGQQTRVPEPADAEASQVQRGPGQNHSPGANGEKHSPEPDAEANQVQPGPGQSHTPDAHGEKHSLEPGAATYATMQATEPKQARRVRFVPPPSKTPPAEGELGQLADDYSCTVTLYPRYLIRPTGVLRIVQIVCGIIMCASADAEQCAYSGFAGLVVCARPSSRAWFHQYQGQGFVLFVGPTLVLANLAWIAYHVHIKRTLCCRAISQPAGPRMAKATDRIMELVYDTSAVVLYVISASVEAWYASDTGTIFRAQWIVATVFAWINTILYGISIAFNLLA